MNENSGATMDGHAELVGGLLYSDWTRGYVWAAIPLALIRVISPYLRARRNVVEPCGFSPSWRSVCVCCM
ncbi:MAG: hypothetical protein U1E27_02420 [Kiritimatiellia bacterium]|nr:hypothetical protein [Kiritimatiellia bacterium]